MKIHRKGWSTILTIWAFCAVMILIIAAFMSCKWLEFLLIALLVFIMSFILYFFRVPSRRGQIIDPRAVTSVADGEVVIVEKVFEPEFFKCECIQVSVYMNFLDVHVNFWPISGKVTYYKYHPGRYLLAFLPKASELNEHSSIAIENEHGPVFFKQMAGTFARRIVNYAEVGKSFEKGKECGLIKFGSRIDMFLPLGSNIDVEIGDEVVATRTIIAELPE